jgi:Flp pilus assembly protein TadG
LQRLRDERGAIGVVVALLMIPLLGFAAIAIDVSAMYAERQQLQNGADAGALAIAQDCAEDACGRSAATAQEFAAANLGSLTSTATVTALTSSHVTVSNSGVRDHLFAPVLGINSSVITATATAEWTAPTGGTASLPIAINRCEFDAQTGGGVPTKAVVRTLLLTTASGPTCANQPDVTPGGFAWVAPNAGSCGRASTLTGPLSRLPASASPDGAPPISCSPADFSSLRKSTVLLPVFDTYAGTGSAATYQVSGYAAFKITGYYFGGQLDWGSPCGGKDRCLQGYFTKKTDRATAFTYGTGAPQLGAGVITLTE